MVSAPNALTLSAFLSLLLARETTATSLDLNPVTRDASVLDRNNPVYGGPVDLNRVKVVVFEDPTVSRAEVREAIEANETSRENVVATVALGSANSSVFSNQRKLEVTNADVQKLEEHFKQPMIVNLNTLKNLYSKSEFKPAPWPSSYWPTYQDGINAKWDGDSASPAEKYAKAFGLKVKDFMNTISANNGIDSMKGYASSCSSDAQCAGRNDGSVCAKRAGSSKGYCIPTWYGICHAWAPASILEPEPRCSVVKNGVTFKPFDIKALLTEAYDGAYVPVVFTGARYDGSGSPRDEYGRSTDAKERDLGPGFFHIAVTNIMGRFKKSFVVDVNADAQVWNQPVRGYDVTQADVMTPDAAATTYFGVPKYPFNDAAVSVAYVRMVFSYINEMVQDGPLVETGHVDSVTVNQEYQYLLELDADQNIIGGEWLFNSQTHHPDFLWFPAEKPDENVVTAVGLSYKAIAELLAQSVSCSSSPSPTSAVPTTTTPSPTTTTPATTAPASTPVTTPPVTTTPAPTSPTLPASGGQCGNDQVGSLPCPSGEYCQPWNPSFYQCRKVDATCGTQETGVDYYGDDLTSFQLLLPEDCCSKCASTMGCKAYTFVNYNADGKAYCYLKRGTGRKTKKIGAVSATIVCTPTTLPTPPPTTRAPPASGSQCGNDAVGPQLCPTGEYCQPWNPNFYQCRRVPATCGVQEVGVDYYGDDLATFQLLLPEQCCDKCATTAGCKAYTFVNYNADGKAYCYLKKGTGQKTKKAGVVSASIAPAKCSQQLVNTDFYGDDIVTVYGIGLGQCCDKCAATAGCKAYTYVSDNVATPACYLKRGTGMQRGHPTAVSGIVNA